MTKRGMPSAAQMRVLEAMERGQRLEHWPGAAEAVSLRGNGSFTPVRWHTWRAIFHAGWAARQTTTEGKANVRHYVITNLGRHALEAARASKGAE